MPHATRPGGDDVTRHADEEAVFGDAAALRFTHLRLNKLGVLDALGG